MRSSHRCFQSFSHSYTLTSESEKRASTSTSSPSKPPQALPPFSSPRRRFPELILAALLLILGLARPALASPADDYTNAIHRGLTLVQFAERGDAPSAQKAIDVLVNGTGDTQPEVLRDLRSSPPDLRDADQRLQALYDALQSGVDTPDPAQASRQLQSILSQPRYAGLSAGRSLFDQIMVFIYNLIGKLLSLLGGSGLAKLPIWIWLIVALAILIAIIIWTVRGGFSRGGREARLRTTTLAARPRLDFFADADRLAAKNDYVGAIKALAGGVAIRLRGEHIWDRSPLTVRELFQQSDRADALQPLLHSFEAASYGHRTPDATSYARAAEAAEPFRRPAA